MNVFQILELIETTQGTNAKGEVLNKHRDNELLKRVLFLTSDPYTNFWVAKVPKVKTLPSESSSDETMRLLLCALEKTMARAVTGNAAKDIITSALTGMSQLEYKWASRIISRKMRLGVGDSSIEKVWPGLVPSFEPSLAKECDWVIENDNLKLLTQFKYPVRVEPKWDGFRCIAVKTKGVVTLFARSGREFDRAPAIKAFLEKNMCDECVLDGEIIGAEWNDTASIIGSRKNHKDDATLAYHVFDCLPFSAWKDQTESLSFAARSNLIQSMIHCKVGDPVQKAAGIIANNEEEILQYYRENISGGLEGVMIKDLGAPYCFKRSEAILKLKPLTSWDCVVVDVLPAREGTKWDGMYTILSVQVPGGGVTRVGTGFSDEEREYLNAQRSNLIGRACEVEGQPPLTDDGKIRFPRFTRWREDWDVSPEVKSLIEANSK